MQDAQALLTPPKHRGKTITMIYKIFRPEEWAVLREAGTTTGAPIDVEDGYIHFSTAGQVAETAAKHFADAPHIVLVACDEARLAPALRWEPSRGGQDFPHLYRALALSDVVSHREIERVNGMFDFSKDRT